MMRYVEYKPIAEEICGMLKSADYITFSTAVHNKVTARTVSHVTDGLDVLFITRNISEKTQQLKQNPYVALAMPKIQIEAIARISGKPTEEKNTLFSKIYRFKFPRFYSSYVVRRDAVVIKCEPRKITLQDYEDNKPIRYVLEVDQKIAYKMDG